MLRADTYTFTPGVGPAGLSYTYSTGETGTGYTGQRTLSDGPYGGTLYDNGTAQPNSLFYCVTGDQYYVASGETGTWAAPSTVGQEEAAYLVSLVVKAETYDGVTLTTTGTGNGKTAVVNGSGAGLTAFENGNSNPSNPLEYGLGAIQSAIWYVMGTMPSGANNTPGGTPGTYWTTASTIKDANTKAYVLAAQSANLAAFAGNTNYMIFTTTTGGQSFISVPPPSPAVPEPGTMVLFGTGVLLMGLGSTRKLLARRRAR